MSPTSYRAAPPRVSEVQHYKELHLTRQTIFSKTCKVFYGSAFYKQVQHFLGAMMHKGNTLPSLELSKP